MKKFLLVFMSAVVLASCSSDSDDDSPNPITEQAAIVGTWNFAGSTDQGEFYPPTDCEKASTLQFKADGTGFENSSYDSDVVEGCETETYTFEYTASEGKLTVTANYEVEETATLSYEINGKTLTFDYGDDSSSTYTKQ